MEAKRKESVENIVELKNAKEQNTLYIKELELAINHKNAELTDIAAYITSNEKKLEVYRTEDNNLENISELTDGLKKIREELTILNKKIEEETAKKQSAQSAEELFVEKIAELKIEKSKLEETLKHITESIGNYQSDIDDVCNQIERLEASKNIENLSAEDEKNILENNTRVISQCSQRLDVLKNLLSDLDAEKTGLFKREKEITTSQQYSNEELRLKISECEKLTVAQTKIEVKIDEYLENLVTNYSVTYESVAHKLTEELIPEVPSYKSDVIRLRRAIMELGNVNLNAIEEFNEVKERYDFYNEQITDLVEAKAKLEETIAEIDKEVKERFLETFVQVAENFNKIFIKLFKGGYADMTLETPNDILNTGIIIEASPPGKKLQNLSLLSGGEKSLTAISLLFAILQVKNPPFVVLDEVEAALDEENVNRFAKFLKLYSEDNQFLVITHRRGTMEAMDTLYGVTMQEKGISYILELELKDMIKNFEEVIE